MGRPFAIDSFLRRSGSRNLTMVSAADALEIKRYVELLEILAARRCGACGALPQCSSGSSTDGGG